MKWLIFTSLIFLYSVILLEKTHAAIVKERSCDVDLMVLTKKSDADRYTYSKIMSFKSKGRIRSPGAIKTLLAKRRPYVQNARTMAHNAVTMCMASFQGNWALNIAQNNECREFLYNDCSDWWRRTRGLEMCPRDHATTTRYRARIEGAPWESPIRIARKYLCKSATSVFPSVERIWVQLQTRGRQTCDPNNSVPGGRAIALYPSRDSDWLAEEIRNFTSAVLGTSTAALKCENGEPSLVPRIGAGQKFKILPQRKIPLIDRRHEFKRREK